MEILWINLPVSRKSSSCISLRRAPNRILPDDPKNYLWKSPENCGNLGPEAPDLKKYQKLKGKSTIGHARAPPAPAPYPPRPLRPDPAIPDGPARPAPPPPRGTRPRALARPPSRSRLLACSRFLPIAAPPLPPPSWAHPGPPDHRAHRASSLPATPPQFAPLPIVEPDLPDPQPAGRCPAPEPGRAPRMRGGGGVG